MFDAEIGRDAERRSDPRDAVDFSGRITTASEWRAMCRIVDLSRNGARLTTYTPLESGSTIWLRLPGMEQRAATVVWIRELTAGCTFHAPLDDGELTTLSAAYAFTPSSAID
jgi:hypothetical protein